MSNRKFKLALCQLRAEPELEDTMAKAESMLREAAENGAQAAMLPEMFCCQYRNASFRLFAERGSADIVEKLGEWAKKYSLLLVGGSIPEAADGKLYNTCYVFDRQGAQLAKYRKIHLFDANLPNMRSYESDTFAAGSEIVVFDTEYGRMGLAICFDIRFPELIRALTMRGAELVFIPAQFTTVTGPKNWEAFVRTRAVDNQIFVAGCCAPTDERIRWRSWGHSTVISPYSKTLCEGGTGEEILYADIDLAEVEESRRTMPTLDLLRRDLYPVAE